jgi:plasmid maintenance system antidote protein VapI
VFSHEEQTKARAALRNLVRSYGSRSCLAEVMGLSPDTLKDAIGGRGRVTPAVLIRASRAAGVPIETMLAPLHAA